MRSLLVPLMLCLLATGCIGNWSNKDLEFAGALPTSAQLKSQLPGVASTGQGIRRDGLNVGEPSKAYTDTKGAATTFNGIVDLIASVLDAVRAIPPSARTTDSRTWGPWNDTKHPGFQLQVVITKRAAGDFAWSIQERPQAGEFFDVISGTYTPTATVKVGQGSFTVDVKTVREKIGSAGELDPIDTIAVSYVTDQPVKQVQMQFTFAPGGQAMISTIGYGYREAADKSASMHFTAVGTDANITELEITSGWLATGAGRADQTVKAGAYAGATALECWDEKFNVVYAKQNWPGGIDIGSASACATLVGP